MTKILDLYSKRQKRLHGDVPDVFSYHGIPQTLRVQIVHIWKDALGDKEGYRNALRGVKVKYKYIVDSLRREYGVFTLYDRGYNDHHYIDELEYFFLHESICNKVIDVIELTFKVIDKTTREYNHLGTQNFDEIADCAILELNTRFKEHGIGYQYEEGEIIRVDSQLLHAEIVKPALQLLNSTLYAGAQQEFLSAYEHHRHQRHKEALNDALKSFESTMKALCDKRGWAYTANDTCSRLIAICYQNNLIPTFWKEHMAALRSLLEGGVPTGRNKLSGHGQGSTTIEVPDHIVSYVLHMTGAAIILLVRSEQEL
ncbi:MAG: hypothetical protein GXP13_03030 [Gammaproteobacteria bacterium]|nr:hypothetical protein [Gammaproteobacteria bacterium]